MQVKFTTYHLLVAISLLLLLCIQGVRGATVEIVSFPYSPDSTTSHTVGHYVIDKGDEPNMVSYRFTPIEKYPDYLPLKATLQLYSGSKYLETIALDIAIADQPLKWVDLRWFGGSEGDEIHFSVIVEFEKTLLELGYTPTAGFEHQLTLALSNNSEDGEHIIHFVFEQQVQINRSLLTTLVSDKQPSSSVSSPLSPSSPTQPHIQPVIGQQPLIDPSSGPYDLLRDDLRPTNRIQVLSPCKDVMSLCQITNGLQIYVNHINMQNPSGERFHEPQITLSFYGPAELSITNLTDDSDDEGDHEGDHEDHSGNDHDHDHDNDDNNHIINNSNDTIPLPVRLDCKINGWTVRFSLAPQTLASGYPSVTYISSAIPIDTRQNYIIDHHSNLFIDCRSIHFKPPISGQSLLDFHNTIHLSISDLKNYSDDDPGFFHRPGFTISLTNEHIQPPSIAITSNPLLLGYDLYRKEMLLNDSHDSYDSSESSLIDVDHYDHDHDSDHDNRNEDDIEAVNDDNDNDNGDDKIKLIPITLNGRITFTNHPKPTDRLIMCSSYLSFSPTQPPYRDEQYTIDVTITYAQITTREQVINRKLFVDRALPLVYSYSAMDDDKDDDKDDRNDDDGKDGDDESKHTYTQLSQSSLQNDVYCASISLFSQLDEDKFTKLPINLKLDYSILVHGIPLKPHPSMFIRLNCFDGLALSTAFFQVFTPSFKSPSDTIDIIPKYDPDDTLYTTPYSVPLFTEPIEIPKFLFNPTVMTITIHGSHSIHDNEELMTCRLSSRRGGNRVAVVKPFIVSNDPNELMFPIPVVYGIGSEISLECINIYAKSSSYQHFISTSAISFAISGDNVIKDCLSNTLFRVDGGDASPNPDSDEQHDGSDDKDHHSGPSTTSILLVLAIIGAIAVVVGVAVIVYIARRGRGRSRQSYSSRRYSNHYNDTLIHSVNH